MKKVVLFFWEIIKIAFIALLIVVPIRTFIFQPFFVRGASMEPNFHNSDYLIVDEISYRFSEPKRGDVIVFKSPLNSRQRFIKRIIGLPFETIKIDRGKIYFEKNGQSYELDESQYLLLRPEDFQVDLEITLKGNEYFVLGDNRSHSLDSRSFGAVSRENIIGKVAFRLWPIAIFAKIAQN